MSKKKKHDEHIDESWLIPYADMLTLLLALFIVLFAMSSVDAAKFKQMAVAFNQELKGGTGTKEFLSEDKPKTDENLKDKQPSQTQSDAEKQAAEQKKKELEELKKLQGQVEQYIKDSKLSVSLQTKLTDRGLLITIMDNALFDSGKADVKPNAVQLANQIAQLLKAASPREIMISGHTDNVPISNSKYGSNWDLSTERAINFMKVLLGNKDLNPAKFSAVGYGEYRPAADNATDAGRAKNRRVEVLILPLVNMN
ncbi:flagellar motor protein MotB [Ectobacillus ponti]|uniref:Flagellar motor protein MotB n=1 Tax=Ectobacillus ponti TaxID=2961894 RepID=A0AA41X6S2_9BACI|nr:flagellar motor protein MotB [Ectobacillus ponti]MCP8967365.1 flagellar motor protein MotB [Ectobacillus ponti]